MKYACINKTISNLLGVMYCGLSQPWEGLSVLSNEIILGIKTIQITVTLLSIRMTANLSWVR